MAYFIGFIGLMMLIASLATLIYMVITNDPELDNYFDED